MKKQQSPQIQTSHQLTEDQAFLLKALIENPAFGILKNIALKEIQMLQDAMVMELDKDAILRLQGRVVGIRSFIMVPQAVAAQYAHIAQKKKENKSPKA